jgi:uncharacterized peroxidase-related enzyme
MTQPKYVNALKLRPLARSALPADLRKYFAVCEEKLGFVPNVLKSYSFDAVKLRAFVDMYNDLMLGDSKLSKLEREMIAVVVSWHNRCFYCLTAHGQAVRKLSGDPKLGELLVMNYRSAKLPKKQRAMLDFAYKMTAEPDKMSEADRQALRKAGFRDRDIWDIASVAAFFNMTNRFASAIDMMPNEEYHAANR